VLPVEGLRPSQAPYGYYAIPQETSWISTRVAQLSVLVPPRSVNKLMKTRNHDYVNLWRALRALSDASVEMLHVEQSLLAKNLNCASGWAGWLVWTSYLIAFFPSLVCVGVLCRGT
jgi:hypothetical protein